MQMNQCNYLFFAVSFQASIRFVGGWRGVNPPLVEDDPHTGDWKFRFGGRLRPPASPDSARPT